MGRPPGRDISIEESNARQRLALYLLIAKGICPALAASRVNETYGTCWTLNGVRQWMLDGCPLDRLCNEIKPLSHKSQKAK